MKPSRQYRSVGLFLLSCATTIAGRAQAGDVAAAAPGFPKLAEAAAQSQPVISAQGDAPARPRQPMVLEEVVVTAQKRSQNLQDVPASIAAVSGDEFVERRLNGMEEVSRALPNIQLNTEAGLAVYTIRGFGAPGGGIFDPSLSAMIDEVPLPVQYFSFAFSDVDNLEILRGPQGTLFGKNTVAGLIKMATREPTYELAGSVNLQYGSDDLRRAEVIGNLPIIDERIAMRLRYTREDRDGFIQNTALGYDGGRYRKEGLGAKVRFDMSDSLSLTVNGRYETSELPHGYGTQAIKCPAYYPPLAQIFDPQFECTLNDRASTEVPEFSEIIGRSASAALSWKAGGYELKTLLAHQRATVDSLLEGDRSPVPLMILPLTPWYKSNSGEVRLLSPPDLSLWNRRVSFVSGVYFNRERQYIDASFDFVTPACAAPFGLAPFLGALSGLVPLGALTGLPQLCAQGASASIPIETLSLIQDKQVTEQAAFAQADYDLTKDLTLTAGLRYSSIETRALHIENIDQCSGLPVCPVGLLAGIGNNSFDDLERTDTKVSSKLSLTYRVSDDINTYASVATGFKPGGYGLYIYSNNGIAAPSIFQPENSISYEIGTKLTLLDGRASLNLAAFRSTISDLQVNRQRAFTQEPTNAGRARSQGVELESRYLLSGRLGALHFSANAGYLDAHYLDYRNAPCPASELGSDTDGNPLTPPVCDLSDRTLANAPKWKTALIVDGQTQVSGWPFLLTAGGDAFWQSLVYFNSDSDRNTAQPAYWRFNARVGIKDLDERWSLTFFVQNLTDEKYLQIAAGIPFVTGGYSGSLAAPRSYTLMFNCNLGGH